MPGKILRTTIGFDFIQRTLKTTGIVLLFVLAFGSFYFDFYDALAVFSAGVWSIINLLFLSALVRAVVRPGGVDKLTAFGSAFLKFPLLYAAGYFLFTIEVFRPVPLIIGLSMVLAVMILKAVARAMLNLDYTNQKSSSRGVA
jgi:hypothetical protein